MDRDEELRRRRGEHTRSYSQDRPIGSGDNAKSIVRGVKQWLPDIPGAVGDLADMLYAGGANVLQGQKRRSIAPLGAGPAIRRAIAKKSPLEQVEMRATPETDWVEEGVRFANPAMFMSPKNIAQFGGLALAGGVPGAAIGAIMPKGLTRANLLHNLTGSPSKIVKMLKEGRISSPSIAVTERTAYPFAEAPTIVFNPQSTRFDPMLNKANQMYSRDMYSFRNKDINELPEKLRTGEQDARFTEGLYAKDPTSKFSGLPDDPGKMLAIGASPRMKSFAHWESDPLGYGVLGHFDEAAQSLSDDLADQTGTWLLENRLRVPTGSRGALSALKNAAENGDSEAQRILYGFAKLPSNYAELKVVGDVPLTKDNVSAMLLPEYYDPPGDYVDRMFDAADEAGIKIGFPSDMVPLKHRSAMKDQLDQIVDWIKSARPGTETPPTVSRYLSPRELTRIHNNPGDVDFLTRQAFVNSPQYSADIAHYLSLEP